jgi:hypothetical protein
MPETEKRGDVLILDETCARAIAQGRAMVKLIEGAQVLLASSATILYKSQSAPGVQGALCVVSRRVAT